MGFNDYRHLRKKPLRNMVLREKISNVYAIVYIIIIIRRKMTKSVIIWVMSEVDMIRQELIRKKAQLNLLLIEVRKLEEKLRALEAREYENVEVRKRVA